MVARFGGCSGLTTTPGTWVDPSDGKEYNDLNTGFYVDADNTEETITFLKEYKEILKTRFNQREISLTWLEINTI